jgi:mRNA deadenylase 3'-5' endonuclease subunit Ccr4
MYVTSPPLTHFHRRWQEVQSNHFQEFLMPELQKHGYTAVYKKKTTELYTANKFAIDGCATFFRKDRFALVKKYEANLQPPLYRTNSKIGKTCMSTESCIWK